MSSFIDKVLAQGAKIGQARKTFTDQVIAQGDKTRHVYADAAPQSAMSLRKALQWLRQAKRYGVGLPLIPHGEEERWIAVMERYGHALATPPASKFMVVEYEHGGSYRTEPDLTRALSTKRVALCVDIESVHAVSTEGLSGFVREPDDAGGLLIWPINYFDEKRDWEFAAAAVIVPRHASIQYVEGCGRKKSVLDRMRQAFFKGEQVLGDAPIEASFQEMLPEIAKKLDDEDRYRIYTETAMDAVWAVLGTLSAMQCSNVVAEDGGSLWVRPDGADDARRIALDPFHGRRVAVGGSVKWVQESTVCFE